TKKLLQRYKHISVRESSGVNIINDLGINNATHVLDPTLQMSRTFWEKYAGKSRSNEPYVLIYQLNSNKEFDKYAKEFARRKGMKLIRFCTRLDQVFLCGFPAIIPDVFGFVSYIFHAEYVITDSFHATAFSINVNTDFISIYPEEFSTRIESILRLTNLQDRHLKSYEDFSYVDLPPTDFSHVNIYLEKERERGDEFLNKALSINN
ncbi:polysaccharide pyruvyl transferase family protein, partial [Noviherbaspirillum sp. ST9]